MQPADLFHRAVEFGAEHFTRLADRRYLTAPLCKTPLGSKDEYLRRWNEACGEVYPEVDRYEVVCGARIDLTWFHDLALLTQVTKKRSRICYQHGRVLYATLARYLRERCRQHLNVVETGTARGFSALSLAKALWDAGATGKVFTFDVIPHDVRIYWNCIRDADGPRTRAELLADHSALVERFLIFHRGDTRLLLARLNFPRVHFAFLDSAHTYKHVMGEFSSIRGRQHPGDLLCFDDYSPDLYPGVVRAADEICRQDGYKGLRISANAQRAYLVAEKI